MVGKISMKTTICGYERINHHAYLLELAWGITDLYWRGVDLTGRQYSTRQLHDRPNSVGSVWGNQLCGWPWAVTGGESS